MAFGVACRGLNACLHSVWEGMRRRELEWIVGEELTMQPRDYPTKSTLQINDKQFFLLNFTEKLGIPIPRCCEPRVGAHQFDLLAMSVSHTPANKWMRQARTVVAHSGRGGVLKNGFNPRHAYGMVSSWPPSLVHLYRVALNEVKMHVNC